MLIKTLLVGDLHLKAEFVLPIVESKIQELDCQQVIFLGDYVDDWDQQRNTDAYLRDLDFLIQWKKRMTDNGLHIINLLGNHDAPYLIDEPRAYSLQIYSGFKSVRDRLNALDLQAAFQLDSFLISHAGYCWGQEVEARHFEALTLVDIEMISELEDHVGIGRGGRYWVGSPIWADYNLELTSQPNPKYLKQVVGHTPRQNVNLDADNQYEIYGIDTFSMSGSGDAPYYKFIGDGDLLMYDNQTEDLTAVHTEWQSSETINKLLAIRAMQNNN